MTAAKGTIRVRCAGPGCGTEFSAARSTTKFCSSTCRSRARRQGPSHGEDPLVKAVRLQLRDAGALEGYVGQAALKVAAQLSASGPAGAAVLSRELDRLMTTACGPSAAPAPAGEAAPATSAVVEDEVDRARRARDEKLARLAAGQ